MIDWRDRFVRLVERKTAEAARAELPPYRTALEQPPGDAVAIGNEFTRRVFDGPFYVSDAGEPALPSASLVFVQSRDGNTGANDPSSIGGGATDAHIIYEGLSRAAADGVLAGAETIRGGDLVFSVWHPEIVRLRESLGLPRHPTQIVATLRGLSFDETLLYNVPDIRVIILTVSGYAREMERDLAARPWIMPLVMHDANDLRAAFEELRTLGQSRISVVGGRTIARALVAADLVQDLYLTTSPKAGGEPNTPLFEQPIQSELILRKEGTGSESGVIFEHKRLR
ncbi:MAG TPA: dihydrofolate reductase family protein [Vicinamibacterales bacterium]|jgi:5-amino-6-(5-phosphoribosylamino)uracil reductase